MNSASSPSWAARKPRPVSRPGGWPDETEVKARLAAASVQLVTMRCEIDALTADLSWLQITASGPPDLADTEGGL